MSSTKKTYQFLWYWWCSCASPVAQRGKKFKLGNSVRKVCLCGKVILKPSRANKQQAG